MDGVEQQYIGVCPSRNPHLVTLAWVGKRLAVDTPRQARMDQVLVSERLTTAGAGVIAALAPAGGDDPTIRFEAIYNAYLPLLRKIAIRKFEIAEQDVDGL